MGTLVKRQFAAVKVAKPVIPILVRGDRDNVVLQHSPVSLYAIAENACLKQKRVGGLVGAEKGCEKRVRDAGVGEIGLHRQAEAGRGGSWAGHP